MSPVAMLDLLLMPEVRQAILDEDWGTLREVCEAHPSLLSQVLADYESPETIAGVLEHIDMPQRAEVFAFLPEPLQDELVEILPNPALAKIIERMSHDDRADLVGRMDDDLQAKVMPLVARADREDIARLLTYDPDTAGAVMTTDYAVLAADLNVAQALDTLRKVAPHRETIYYVYVVDAGRHLIGVLTLKDLILAKPRQLVREIMTDHVVSIAVDMELHELARLWPEYDLIALPVVDAEGRLVGMITHDDVFDVVEDVVTADAQRMGAVEPIRGAYLDSSVWLSVRSRVIWLWLLFAAEMGTSVVLDSYSWLLNQYLIVVLFMPVITATGGNSGSQAASLITRALALDEVEPGDWFRVAFRELLSGLFLGLAVGTLGILVVLLFHGDTPRMSVVLMLALVAVTTCGSLIGSMMPLIFERVGLDPAYSSGPFVASVIDVVGLIIYCGIAATLLVGGG